MSRPLPAVAGPVVNCDQCGDPGRREFIAQATLLAAAALLTSCVQATAPSTGPVTVVLANFPGLGTVGTIVVVDNGASSGRPIVAIRTGASAFLALSLVCPHRGCTIGVTGSSFQCPCHGAQFNGSGIWTGGQGTSNMYRYATTYDATAGTLTIS